MTDEVGPPLRARLVDFLRPSRLYDAIDARPTFILPILVLVVAASVYAQVAFGKAFPLIAPDMLMRSEVTETELALTFRLFIAFLACLVPFLATFATAIAAWLLLLVLRARQPLSLVVSLFAWSGLWISLGLLVKTGLVLWTGSPDPPTNLGLLIPVDDLRVRTLFVLTSPFLILAIVWTVRGLAHWGTHVLGQWTAGALSWLALAAFLSLFSGSTSRLAPSGPVDVSSYRTFEAAPITFRFPPRHKMHEAERIAKALSGASLNIAEKVGFTARPITVIAFPDHETLERATGEFLHVQVVSSIRGKDLLYLEMPGYSLVVPGETGLREALRYVIVMQLAPELGDAPRWFVHGVAHARVYPGSPGLERQYRAILDRIGVPSYNSVLDPHLFRTPDGPILARSIVDHLAFFYGPEAVEGVVEDLASGTPFRDALYARTRLTTSALEAGWQDHARTLLSIEEQQPQGSPGP